MAPIEKATLTNGNQFTNGTIGEGVLTIGICLRILDMCVGVRNELWMKKISQFDWPTGDTSCHGKQISVHTRELAPETDSCNRFSLGACSLISNQFDMREQNSGAKVLLRNIFFR